MVLGAYVADRPSNHFLVVVRHGFPVVVEISCYQNIQFLVVMWPPFLGGISCFIKLFVFYLCYFLIVKSAWLSFQSADFKAAICIGLYFSSAIVFFFIYTHYNYIHCQSDHVFKVVSQKHNSKLI